MHCTQSWTNSKLSMTQLVATLSSVFDLRSDLDALDLQKWRLCARAGHLFLLSSAPNAPTHRVGSHVTTGLVLAAVTTRRLDCCSSLLTYEYLSPSHCGQLCRTFVSLSTLDIENTVHSTIGDRTFPATAASVWNSLPESVRSSSSLQVFRSRLKTEFFAWSYRHD